jgi:hypothetical protein
MLQRATTLLIAVLLLATACSSDEDTGPRYLPGAGSGGTGDYNNPGMSGSAGAAGTAGLGGAGVGAVSGTTGNVPIGDGCAAISETATNQLQPADIIFAIDNSGSMDEEIVFVREQMNRFSQLITDSGIDVRIIVISAAIGMQDPDSDGDSDEQDNGICIDAPLGSGSCPEDSLAPRYVHVAEEVGSSDALNLFVDTFPSWRDQLRPNATKTFVVVTDDDATDEPLNSASAFTSAITALDPQFASFTFSGIYCFSECPDAAEIGRVYIDLVAQTMGVGGDLCLQDFAPVFDDLADAVIGASQLDCEWEIPAPPPGQTLDPSLVNVQYTPSGTGTAETVVHHDNGGACAGGEGWHYDDNVAPTRVIACPATCTRLQADDNAKLDVLFGCQTINSPQ